MKRILSFLIIAAAVVSLGEAVKANANSSGSSYAHKTEPISHTRIYGSDSTDSQAAGEAGSTENNENTVTYKYVSENGSNKNDGDSEETPYATIRKAIKEGADVVYVSAGNYTEQVCCKFDREVTIIGYGAVFSYDASQNLKKGSAYWDFRNERVCVRGITIQIEGETDKHYSGFFVRCGTAEFTDCTVTGAPYMGFRLDGSEAVLTRCIASRCGIDGINAHDVSDKRGYFTSEGTFIDCAAFDNGDDGLSYHENGIIHVYGGMFYRNKSAGVAPHGGCNGDILYARIYENRNGIEAYNTVLGGLDPFTTDYPIIKCIGSKIRSNGSNDLSGYGVTAKYYHIILEDCIFFDNKAGNYDIGVGSLLEKYSSKPMAPGQR